MVLLNLRISFWYDLSSPISRRHALGVLFFETVIKYLSLLSVCRTTKKYVQSLVSINIRTLILEWCHPYIGMLPSSLQSRLQSAVLVKEQRRTKLPKGPPRPRSVAAKKLVMEEAVLKKIKTTPENVITVIKNMPDDNIQALINFLRTTPDDVTDTTIQLIKTTDEVIIMAIKNEVLDANGNTLYWRI